MSKVNNYDAVVTYVSISLCSYSSFSALFCFSFFVYLFSSEPHLTVRYLSCGFPFFSRAYFSNPRPLIGFTVFRHWVKKGRQIGDKNRWRTSVTQSVCECVCMCARGRPLNEASKWGERGETVGTTHALSQTHTLALTRTRPNGQLLRHRTQHAVDLEWPRQRVTE